MASIKDIKTTFFGNSILLLIMGGGFLGGGGFLWPGALVLGPKLLVDHPGNCSGASFAGVQVSGTSSKRGVRHSMHLSRRFAHSLQTYVCPHGKTTGNRTWASNSSKQIMQWNEKGEAIFAALMIQANLCSKKGSQWCKSVFRVFSFRGMFETIDVADVSFQIAVYKVNQLPFIPLIPSERFGEGIE